MTKKPQQREILRSLRLPLNDEITELFQTKSDFCKMSNMPYELGLFVGCQKYGSAKHRQKVTLILDTQRYRYQKFLSDIAGQDIKAHENDPRKAVEVVRKWLGASPQRTKQHGATAIWERYQQFQVALPAYCAAPEVNMTPDELRGSFVEYVQVIKNFIIGLDTKGAVS